jgi:hypothetical protein
VRNLLGAHRRLVLAVALPATVGLVVLVALAVFVALGATGHLHYAAHRVRTTTNRGQSLALAAAGSRPSVAESGLPASASSTSPTSTPNPVRLSITHDPRAYATAYATALFSYDTRRQSEAAWTAALTAGLDPAADVRPDNIADLADRTPPAAVWATMTSSAQHATFAVTSAWVPTLWTENAAAYPAGAAAITVSGTQQVSWSGGSSSVPQAVTLLLLCPPYNGSCVVNRIAAQVLQ